MADEPKDQLKYAMAAMSWHGWGSPVGLGLFLVAIALVIVLLRYAWVIG